MSTPIVTDTKGVGLVKTSDALKTTTAPTLYLRTLVITWSSSPSLSLTRELIQGHQCLNLADTHASWSPLTGRPIGKTGIGKYKVILTAISQSEVSAAYTSSLHEVLYQCGHCCVYFAVFAILTGLASDMAI
jgi:hypothetical protein